MSIPININGDVVGYRDDEGKIMSLHPTWGKPRAQALTALHHLKMAKESMGETIVLPEDYNLTRDKLANMIEKIEARIVGLDLQDCLDKTDERIKR